MAHNYNLPQKLCTQQHFMQSAVTGRRYSDIYICINIFVKIIEHKYFSTLEWIKIKSLNSNAYFPPGRPMPLLFLGLGVPPHWGVDSPPPALCGPPRWGCCGECWAAVGPPPAIAALGNAEVLCGQKGGWLVR